MNPIEGLILGTVQGLTEFLPISSSGHLILSREAFGLSSDHGLAVDAVLQLATILAVGIYFARDLAGMAVSAARMLIGRAVEAKRRILVLAVVLGTIPAVVLGLALEDLMETAFRDARLVAVTLIAGGLLMWAAERAVSRSRKNPPADLTVRKGVAIGLFQALALIPGVSRSGATISGGLFAGLSREASARFSFLLAFPVILGSGLKKLSELGSDGAVAALGVGLALGFVAAFIVGMACIHFLLRYLRTRTLMAFVWYRFGLAIVALAFLA